jgi:hypothetical protein
MFSHFLVVSPVSPGLWPTLVDSSSERARAVVRALEDRFDSGDQLGDGLAAQGGVGLPESSDRNFSALDPAV